MMTLTIRGLDNAGAVEQVAPRDQTYKDDREGEKKYLDQLVGYWSAPTRVATRLRRA